MSPKFTRTTIPEKETLGEKLAKKRSALGYDIKEAERSTKIRAKYLEALESGNYDQLPPDVYVRGFLKNYSAFLRLDAEKVIRLYLKERGLAENVKKATNPAAQKDKKTKKPKVIITPQRIVIGSIVFMAIALIIYVGWQISLLAAPPKLEVLNPKNNSKTEIESIIVEGKTDPGAEVYINEVPIGIDPEGKFAEKVSLQPGVNLIKIAAKNKLNKITQTTRTVLAEIKDTPAKIDENKALEAKISIGPNSNLIYVELDGKPLSEKKILMLPGSSQVLYATKKIIISASDGGSIRLTLNGQDLGPLGKEGEKIERKEYSIESL